MGEGNNVLLKGLPLYELGEDSSTKVVSTVRALSAVNLYLGQLAAVLDVNFTMDPSLSDRFLKEDDEATREQKDDQERMDEELKKKLEDANAHKEALDDFSKQEAGEEEGQEQPKDDEDPDAVKEEAPKEQRIKLVMN